MPEGDTIYRAAQTLHRALAGQTVSRFESGLARLAQFDRDAPIRGRVIERVESIGKHLLIKFSGGIALRTHMRMNGSWHIYRPGERWQITGRAMRIVIETQDWVAVAFNVYVAEFVRTADLAHHHPIATLGPDLLGDFDSDAAVANMRANGGRPLHEVVLDQRVMAGIGNVYKSEILFLAKIHPDTRVNALDDSTLRTVIDVAHRLLQANAADKAGPGIVTYRGLRRTTGRIKPEDQLWVYSRGGRPCRKCGTPIRSRKDGDSARVTYWCPECQRL